MEDSFPSGQLRMVVLKWDRLSGDLIRQTIGKVWAHAEVGVFQRGFEALEAIYADTPEMFITGVKVLPDAAHSDEFAVVERRTFGRLAVELELQAVIASDFDFRRRGHGDLICVAIAQG